jgi:hypothetical protein
MIDVASSLSSSSSSDEEKEKEKKKVSLVPPVEEVPMSVVEFFNKVEELLKDKHLPLEKGKTIYTRNEFHPIVNRISLPVSTPGLL